jgi:hypothetical protein
VFDRKHATLYIDGHTVVSGEATGVGDSIETIAPVYVGGVPVEIANERGEAMIMVGWYAIIAN